jgi:hypothetical protein
LPVCDRRDLAAKRRKKRKKEGGSRITRIGANGGKMEEDRKSETGSPLDVEGVDLGVNTAEVVDMVRENYV